MLRRSSNCCEGRRCRRKCWRCWTPGGRTSRPNLGFRKMSFLQFRFQPLVLGATLICTLWMEQIRSQLLLVGGSCHFLVDFMYPSLRSFREGSCSLFFFQLISTKFSSGRGAFGLSCCSTTCSLPPPCCMRSPAAAPTHRRRRGLGAEMPPFCHRMNHPNGNTVDGRNPLCTTLKPWLKPLLVWYFQGNRSIPRFVRCCRFRPSTVRACQNTLSLGLYRGHPCPRLCMCVNITCWAKCGAVVLPVPQLPSFLFVCQLPDVPRSCLVLGFECSLLLPSHQSTWNLSRGPVKKKEGKWSSTTPQT